MAPSYPISGIARPNTDFGHATDPEGNPIRALGAGEIAEL
jgi:hypothetical protein